MRMAVSSCLFDNFYILHELPFFSVEFFFIFIVESLYCVGAMISCELPTHTETLTLIRTSLQILSRTETLVSSHQAPPASCLPIRS